jgi:hypothetical protein
MINRWERLGKVARNVNGVGVKRQNKLNLMNFYNDNQDFY